MDESYPNTSQYYSDPGSRLRDIEEKQRLLKDRVLLIGQNLIENRDSTFNELQELKKAVIIMQEENKKIKDFIQRISEQLSDLARREELMIIQRQLDMIKPNLK